MCSQETSHNVNKNPRLFEMEQQLRNVESALKGAGSKKSTISNDITSLKRSKSVTYVPEDEDSLNNYADNNQSHNIYLETDLDRNITENISTINDSDRHKGNVVNNNNDNLTNHNNINSNITDDISNNINNNSSDLVNKNFVTNHPRPSRLSAFESLKIKIPEKRQQQTMNANHASQSKNYNEQQYNIASDRNVRTNDNLISKSYDMNHNFESTNTSRSVLPYNNNNVNGIKGGGAEPPASSSHIQTRASYIQKVHTVGHHSPELGAEFDENTITKAVLRPPPQVDIPQRYIPDPEDLNNIKNNLNPVQNYFKQQKVEQMKKLLAAQSLQEFNLNELAATNGEDVNERIRLELKEREDILDMKMSLAKQVTEKSRHLAGLNVANVFKTIGGKSSDVGIQSTFSLSFLELR
ncbi:hypothetical protein HELRODRAFT_188475 [Helobdella robusta]|uniref:Uncharacterized protein n=1 Tax=Helobdella robusta TaxID=6412 RepID=T1FQ13_HELRO|nr:hypothetical protein HELRODRAFT_188475 [Helobdella robusta]ESO01785.1 hypothetical protein HELRODRAFT_188475 [Helobdella robusta]